MMMETLTQRQLLPNGVPPQSPSGTRLFTAGVDMSLVKRAMFTLYIGAVTSGSISAWLQESSDNFNSDVPTNDAASSFANSSGNNVSATALTTSNSIVTFEVRTDQLTTGKRYVRLEVKETTGNATPVCVVAEGDEALHKPVSGNSGSHLLTNGKQLVVS
jgi:hypothetical protein